MEQTLGPHGEVRTPECALCLTETDELRQVILPSEGEIAVCPDCGLDLEEVA